MSVLVALLIGVGVGGVGWVVLRPLLARPPFLRRNYREHEVSTAGGLVLVTGAVGGALALSALVRLVELDVGPREVRQAVIVAVVGFGFLGLLDDLVGDTATTGYRGHLAALRRGDVTSGVVKIVGGIVVALAATVMATDEALPLLLADGALVALCANLANLLDRRPGRVLKVGLVAFVALVAASLADPRLAATALVAGVALALLPVDLGERVMVGDTGANPWGATLGLGLVVACSPGVRLGALAIVLGLNLLSERVSFTEVIARNGPLRRLDELGRHPG